MVDIEKFIFWTYLSQIVIECKNKWVSTVSLKIAIFVPLQDMLLKEYIPLWSCNISPQQE